jgi:hypothetical protein
LSEYVQKAIGDVSGKDCSGIRAAAQAHGETNSIATEDGWKKEGGEESAQIALRAGGEIELRVGRVDDHAPLGDADEMREEIAEKDDKKARDRDAMNGFDEQGQRQEMEKNAEDYKCGEPPESNGQAAAGFIFGVVGANHELQRGLGPENFIDLGSQLKIERTDALHAVGVEVNFNFVPDIEPIRMMVQGFSGESDFGHLAEGIDEILTLKILVEFTVG